MSGTRAGTTDDFDDMIVINGKKIIAEHADTGRNGPQHSKERGGGAAQIHPNQSNSASTEHHPPL